MARRLALRNTGRRSWIRVPMSHVRVFSPDQFLPRVGTAKGPFRRQGSTQLSCIHYNGYAFAGVALITRPTSQVPQFSGRVTRNGGIMMTGSVVYGLVRTSRTDFRSIINCRSLSSLLLDIISASVALRAIILWRPQSRCSCLPPCLRKFRLKPFNAKGSK